MYCLRSDSKLRVLSLEYKDIWLIQSFGMFINCNISPITFFYRFFNQTIFLDKYVVNFNHCEIQSTVSPMLTQLFNKIIFKHIFLEDMIIK